MMVIILLFFHVPFFWYPDSRTVPYVKDKNTCFYLTFTLLAKKAAPMYCDECIYLVDRMVAKVAKVTK